MAKTPNGKKWTEIQMSIAAISVTATLGLWNLFSIPSQTAAPSQAEPTSAPTDPSASTETAAADPVPTTLAFKPIKVIYGGTIPVQQQVIQVAPAVSAKKAKSGGGGQGGQVQATPPPHTGSSK